MTTLPDHPHHVGERVHLLVDVPNLGLHSGAVGSVCSVWAFAYDTYEVEFAAGDQTCPVRAMVTSEQIATDEPPPA
jgi:Domain of unknown function (DUF4926)